MKKIALFITGLAMLTQAKADEGMWTIYNLPPQVYEIMQNEGFTMTYNDLYYGENALKNAVVNFSGYCSGVVVSPDGLVFTNHHCGFEAIRSHSTVEHDYMLNGFYAKTYEEELPNKDMFVSFMIDQRDITDRLVAMGLEQMSNDQRELLIDSLTNAMTDSVKRIDKTYHVSIDPFYEGNRYYATTYQDFTDLRLVFTIPKSMGKFGGETDNWMWPRQTCDFSVFRIYADPKTNGPAEYSEENVPYHPKRWAQVSMQGYNDRDFAMTIGYPGSTERYLSSYGIKQMRDCRELRAGPGARRETGNHDQAHACQRGRAHQVRQQVCPEFQLLEELHRHEQMHRLHRHHQPEGGLRAEDTPVAGLYGLPQVQARLRQDGQPLCQQLRAYLHLLLPDGVVLPRNMSSSALQGRSTAAWKCKGPEDKPNKQYHLFKDNSDEWDEALEKEVLAAMLKTYAEQVDGKTCPNSTTPSAPSSATTTQIRRLPLQEVDALMKKGKKLYVNKKDFEKDPGVQFGMTSWTSSMTCARRCPSRQWRYRHPGALPLRRRGAHGARPASLQRCQLHHAPELTDRWVSICSTDSHRATTPPPRASSRRWTRPQNHRLRG